MGSFSNGWALAKQSMNVLRLDKELMLFPVLSTLSCLAVIATFAAPIALTGKAEEWFHFSDASQHHHGAPADPLFFVALFVFYFANYFVVAFFNAALIACAIERFGGGDPTLGSGIRAAASRLPQLLGWALVAATVGFILKIIEDRGKGAGRIASGLLGIAWSVATYFTVPVLVVERVGPIEAVKRSMGIMRKTWGEAAVGNASISGVALLAMLASAIPAAVGIWATGAGAGPWPALGGIAATVLLMVVVGLLSATLHTIMVAAVYEFAASGRVPAQFEEELLRGAFRVKGSKR